MVDFTTLGWAVAATAWVVLAVYVYRIDRRVGKHRLMRCPETGSITLVDVALASRGAGKAPEAQVQRCALWPEKASCAQGCLSRHAETLPGCRVNLHALRPFERSR
jgi:hypothetical protein